MENISEAPTNQDLIQDRKKYYNRKRHIWRVKQRQREKTTYRKLQLQPDILPYFIKLPHEIKCKIKSYYLSFGSPGAVAIRPEIINKCRNNSISLWFANVDYYTSDNRKYMLNKAIGCPFGVLCDLRIALIDNNNENGTLSADIFLKTRRANLIHHRNTLTKNELLRLIEEEGEIILSNL